MKLKIAPNFLVSNPIHCGVGPAVILVLKPLRVGSLSKWSMVVVESGAYFCSVSCTQAICQDSCPRSPFLEHWNRKSTIVDGGSWNTGGDLSTSTVTVLAKCVRRYDPFKGTNSTDGLVGSPGG